MLEKTLQDSAKWIRYRSFSQTCPSQITRGSFWRVLEEIQKIIHPLKQKKLTDFIIRSEDKTFPTRTRRFPQLRYWSPTTEPCAHSNGRCHCTCVKPVTLENSRTRRNSRLQAQVVKFNSEATFVTIRQFPIERCSFRVDSGGRITLWRKGRSKDNGDGKITDPLRVCTSYGKYEPVSMHGKYIRSLWENIYHNKRNSENDASAPRTMLW